MNCIEQSEQVSHAFHFDQRIILHGVSWRQYEALLVTRGDSSGVRIAYLDGELELMTPSIDHEYIKKMLARLLEAWADETETELTGFGSWTVRRQRKKCGVEPDECYILGSKRKSCPDLAIEVMWTPGGLDKLEIYRDLGVSEVWIWRDDAIHVYSLASNGYQRRKTSELLPELDLGQMAKFILDENQSRAVRRFRAMLRHH